MLALEDGNILVHRPDAPPFRVNSPKWRLFLGKLLLARLDDTGGVGFDDLMSFACFRHGRAGVKSARTIAVEIDNFRRKMAQLDVGISKTRTARGVTFALSSGTPVSANRDAVLALLATLPQPRLPLGDILTTPLPLQLAWLTCMLRARVAFGQGDVHQTLDHLEMSLDVAADPLLKGASYAEIARTSYRADRDRTLDLRDAAVHFAQQTDLPPEVARIFAPRIATSYAFHEDRAPEEKLSNLSHLVETFQHNSTDLSGLTRALTMRGLQQRRVTGETAALPDLRLAAALSITVGDPELMQASIFNLLACLETSTAVPAKAKIDMSETNYWFCSKLGIGAESAQGSLLLAQFYLQNSDTAAARIAMSRAVTLMSAQRNRLDVAFFFYTMVCYRQVRATGGAPHPRPARQRACLAHAARIYRSFDNVIGQRKTAALQKALGFRVTHPVG